MDLGSLSLDFAASGLTDRGDLGKALHQSEVLSSMPAVTSEGLEDALRLQGAVERSLRAVAAFARIAPRDAATLNSYASEEPPAVVLQPDETAVRVSTDPVRAALSAIARDAIETIARRRRELRICADESCQRIFLDRSRGKRRRWCSMRTCGNRAKVTSFRRRSG